MAAGVRSDHVATLLQRPEIARGKESSITNAARCHEQAAAPAALLQKVGRCEIARPAAIKREEDWGSPVVLRCATAARDICTASLPPLSRAITGVSFGELGSHAKVTANAVFV